MCGLRPILRYILSDGWSGYFSTPWKVTVQSPNTYRKVLIYHFIHEQMSREIHESRTKPRNNTSATQDQLPRASPIKHPMPACLLCTSYTVHVRCIYGPRPRPNILACPNHRHKQAKVSHISPQIISQL